jgi:aspartate-semialdehyde dehydrogenase
MKRTVGIVGWRGMVGSVLIERMLAEGDFELIEPLLFSTSQIGGRGPALGVSTPPVGDANLVDALAKLEIIVSCQGGDYTKAMHPALRRAGWKGWWIDAASALRMADDSVIVLDPVNRPVIDAGLARGVRDFIGGNCTVSLMLMAMHGLLARGWVEWISTMTYQAASGAGARQMRELAAQTRALGTAAAPLLDDPASAILELDRAVTSAQRDPRLPVEAIGAPLAGSLIPWIDAPMEGGRTREEWKGMAEGNKILGLDPPVPIDGICVRVGAMRCHSQALTIKLRRELPLDAIVEAIGTANDWVQVVPNDRESTIARLSPAAVGGTLAIPVGRVHPLVLGPGYLGCFTVGDQLLWGAAEPLRRMLRILLEHLA